MPPGDDHVRGPTRTVAYRGNWIYTLPAEARKLPIRQEEDLLSSNRESA